MAKRSRMTADQSVIGGQVKYVALSISIAIVTCGLALGQAQYRVLYNFGGYSDGTMPASDLVLDRHGNLYGTTTHGGTSQAPPCQPSGGCGTVFELSPTPNGWKETILQEFCSNYSFLMGQCLDGFSPQAGLVLDSQGNLFGTTNLGGNQFCPLTGYGCGIVFELSPSHTGWTQTVIYNFCTQQTANGCLDGVFPYGQLVLDNSGNLYGTASGGGTAGTDYVFGGTVFELSQNGSGWSQSVLYNFCSVQPKACLDGSVPMAGVTFDKSGNLYGTTEFGGGGEGTVYKLSPGSAGWKETVLRSFGPATNQGENPSGKVSVDALDHLYSALSAGGLNNEGVLLELRPSGASSEFFFDGTDGAMPTAGLLLDYRKQMIYGTTSGGGNYGAGTIFQISPEGHQTVLYSFFCSLTNCADGGFPVAGLVRDPAGNLYGVTQYGGAYSGGVAFEFTPPVPQQ